MGPFAIIDGGILTNYLHQKIECSKINTAIDVYVKMKSNRIIWHRFILVFGENGDCLPIMAQLSPPSPSVRPSLDEIGDILGVPIHTIKFDQRDLK